jgi:CRP-like cAMP-binding protein
MAVIADGKGSVTIPVAVYNELMRTIKQLGGVESLTPYEYLNTAETEVDYSQYETPASRTRDPITSHLAEEHINKSGIRKKQRDEVLMFVREYPGHTSQEYGKLHKKYDRDTFSRRLPELRDRGLIHVGHKTRCAVTGRLAVTWWPR